MRGFGRIDEQNLLLIPLQTGILVEIETNPKYFRGLG